MPPPSRLKVFRTPIGFHDAYVAASSRKAALAAWGSDSDLFARGAAELVTDPALTAEPLAAPGAIVKRLRGTAEEQIAALPPDRPRRTSTTKSADDGPHRPDKGTAARPVKAPPRPRPSRAAIDAADRAIANARARHAEQRRDLAAREAALTRERRSIEAAQDAETAALAAGRETAEAHYARDMAHWRH